MEENFKNKIRSLREAHFPGRSLRSLSDELETHLGEHFYAYLSKIEAGALPSVEFLKKIKTAYGLSEKEYKELIESYLKQKFEDEFVSEAQRSGAALEPEPLLFRKVKRKKS